MVGKKGKNLYAVNAGHGTSADGSWDPGTTYHKGKVNWTEAGLMRRITRYMVKYLRGNGVNIQSDVDVQNKRNMIADVALANKDGAKVYISIHCDYYLAPSGTLPLYVSNEGRKLAISLNRAVMRDMGLKTRGICKRTDLYELNATNGVACIFETGSISKDLSTIRQYKKYGRALAKGLCDYLGVKFKDKMA